MTKRYRVIAENVTTPAGWKGDEPATDADGRVATVTLHLGDVIPDDVGKRARQSKVTIDALPAKSIASLVLNDFVEEIGG